MLKYLKIVKAMLYQMVLDSKFKKLKMFKDYYLNSHLKKMCNKLDLLL